MGNKYTTSELIEYLDNVQKSIYAEWNYDGGKPIFKEIQRRLLELDKKDEIDIALSCFPTIVRKDK